MQITLRLDRLRYIYYLISIIRLLYQKIQSDSEYFRIKKHLFHVNGGRIELSK